MFTQLLPQRAIPDGQPALPGRDLVGVGVGPFLVGVGVGDPPPVKLL